MSRAWDEVDLQQGVIYLGAAREKTSRGRIIALSDVALRTLRAQPRFVETNHVFVNRKTGQRYKSIWTGWVRLRKGIGCPYIRIHDLRHTFATYTRRMGMDRQDRKSLMGHSTEEAHSLYAAADPVVLRAIMNKHSPSTLLTQEREFTQNLRLIGETKTEQDQ